MASQFHGVITPATPQNFPESADKSHLPPLTRGKVGVVSIFENLPPWQVWDRRAGAETRTEKRLKLCIAVGITKHLERLGLFVFPAKISLKEGTTLCLSVAPQ
jgi:hypothetical protein